MITVLCFSRDRPLQLDGYLRSLARTSGGGLPVTVLYRARPAFAAAYQELRVLHPEVAFVEERDLRAQIVGAIRGCATPFLMFGCDDVVFKQPWEPPAIAATFERLPSLAGFSLRLGREITYCQPLDRACTPPPFFEEEPFLVWPWRGEPPSDWTVPFELDCTVYPLALARLVADELADDPRRWGQPNRFEIHGNRILRPHAERWPHLAAYPSARANCLAINRVQSWIEYPIFGGAELTPEALLEAFQRGARLDVDAYRGRVYDCVHIGEALFTSTRADGPGSR